MTNTTPEPELNVEARIERLLDVFTAEIEPDSEDQSQYDSSEEQSNAQEAAHTEAHAAILALIQQVSDQRVGEFAAKLKTKAVMGRAGEKPDPFIHKIIDQTLADYLSHKTLL